MPASCDISGDAGTTTGLAVTVKDAGLKFGSDRLFENLDIDLPAGQWTCLLGPSGVGKTSLLRLIAGLGHGATGEVACGDGAPLAGRAAYMAQQDLLLPWLPVLENALLGARLRGDRPDTERASGLLEDVGLGTVLTARPAALSGGMRHRAALVRTLMEDRPVVLMDEPFSALDAITRIELQAMAATLLAGRTVLLITHDPLEALRLSHRIHVMSGRPAQLGAALLPAGTPPRDVADKDLLAQQAELFARLSAAKRREGANP